MPTKTKIIFFALIICFALGAGTVFAQSFSAEIGSPKIDITVTPDNPKPQDRITIEIDSTWINLNQADIAWTENGVLTKTGVGQTKYFVTAGKAGSFIKVGIIIRAVDGSIFEDEVNINPGTVDILWETGGTVPPFYKGKAPYTMLGKVKMVAVPTMYDEKGQLLDSRQLVYTWEINNKVQGPRSGYGRNTFLINERIYRMPYTVKVTATSNDYKYVAEGDIEMDAVLPIVELYENNPIYGVFFNNALGNTFSIKTQEFAVSAFPYFFDTKTRYDSKLAYTWLINGSTAESFVGPEINLRNTDNSTGKASLDLNVANTENMFQSGAKESTISFGVN